MNLPKADDVAKLDDGFPESISKSSDGLLFDIDVLLLEEWKLESCMSDEDGTEDGCCM